MSFTLPDLPYPHDALAPYMSRETLEYHHDKHHLAYVNNGNNLLKGTEWEGKSLEEVVKGSFGKNAGLFNNAGQHYNHLHFWKWMKPNGGGDKIPGKLEKKIIADLGSVAKMKEDFIQAGVTQFGSGWCWLAVKDGKIVVTKTAERREPAGAWRQADPRLRRVGALLLHRLPQSAAGLPQGVPRPPGELGPRRRDVRRGDQVAAARYARPASRARGRRDTSTHAEARARCRWTRARHVERAFAIRVSRPARADIRPRRSEPALADSRDLRRARRRSARHRRGIVALTFRDYGLGWDDYTHSEYGDLLVALYASGFRDQRALSFVNLYMYGGGFDLLAALAAKVLPFDLFETRRLMGAAVGTARPVRHLAASAAASAARSPGWSRSCCSPPARSITATCS